MRDLSPTEPDQRKVLFAIQQLIQGRNNANGNLTFAPNTTETLVEAETVNGDAAIFLTPRDVEAATAVWHVSSIIPGTIVITHDSAPSARQFAYIILGG